MSPNIDMANTDDVFYGVDEAAELGAPACMSRDPILAYDAGKHAAGKTAGKVVVQHSIIYSSMIGGYDGD